MQITVETPASFCEDTGYTCLTTYYEDLSIAEHFGMKAIRDTLQKELEQAKTNYQWLTELVMMVNWKSWRWADANPELSMYYAQKYYELSDFAQDYLKGDELTYYYEVTD